MRKELKNTYLFFVLSAGLIFFLHTTIPHHHHYNYSPYSSQQTSNDHQGNKPLKCHAYNDLAVDKIGITTNNYPITETIPASISEKTDFIPALRILDGNLSFIKRKEKIPCFNFLTSIPTRGSPLSA